MWGYFRLYRRVQERFGAAGGPFAQRFKQAAFVLFGLGPGFVLLVGAVASGLYLTSTAGVLLPQAALILGPCYLGLGHLWHRGG